MRQPLVGLLLLASGVASVAMAGTPADSSARPGHMQLVLPAGDGPLRVELRVTLGDQPLATAWDEAFSRLFKFFDADGDQSLNQEEAARLPSAFSLRQLSWGQFAPFTGHALPFDGLDRNGDGRADIEEVSEEYRRLGLGTVLVGFGRPAATDLLTDAILVQVDADRNGETNLAEWQAAAEALGRCDHDDDALISPAELVPGVAYPGAAGSILLSAHADESVTDGSDAPLPSINLAAGPMVPESAAVFLIQFDSRHVDAPSLRPVEGAHDNLPDRRLHTATAHFELRGDRGMLAGQTVTARKRLTALFTECDVNSNHSLKAAELAVPKADFFQRSLRHADANADGVIAASEFAGWFEILEQFARRQVLLTILDHGAGLFELLDADHDGALSVRELRTASSRLADAAVFVAGRLDRSKLPRQWIATVSHGCPRVSLVKPTRAGPDWFLAMDRNSDGDISPLEFLGASKLFKDFDTDDDQLLSAAEASRHGAADSKRSAEQP